MPWCSFPISHFLLSSKNANRKQQRAIGENEGIPFPRAKLIPSMTAVLHNQPLFQALVACLKAPSSGYDGLDCGNASSAGSSSQLANSLYTPGSRNRSQSIDLSTSSAISEVVSNKSMKLGHGQSPLVGKRTVSTYAKPQLNVRVLAATILYVALEPFDHWPVQLIEAYAEDCFGPRSWVDDPACRLLVQNLALVHVGNAFDGTQDDNAVTLEADAFIVAEHYRALKEQQPLVNSKAGATAAPAALSAAASSSNLNFSPVRGDAKRRGSLSSSATSMDGAVPSIISPLKRKRSTSTSIESEATRLSPTTSSATKEQNTSVAVGPKQATISPTRVKGIQNPDMMKKSAAKDEDESDSGDEERVSVVASLGKRSEDVDGSSSSSGEDEEVLMDERSVDGSTEMAGGELSPREVSATFSDLLHPETHWTIPFQQRNLNFARVRQRYFGLNLEYSHLAISEKLSERFDIKSKQNSGLLQCLPSFTSIPSVRTLITGNLEKWLQSPALSGLARSLFSTTVNNMKNADPPLPADLDALDNILHMRLKANQLNAHVENVTAIATKIPTAAVAKHIYGHLLRELLVSMDSPESSFMDHLAMLQAVHGVLPDAIGAEGIAASLLDLLLNPPGGVKHWPKTQAVRRIRSLIRTIANKFGSSFDAYHVIREILACRVLDSEVEWTLLDEENRGRIIFQCATLLVTSTYTSERIQPAGKSIKIVGPTEEEIESLRVQLKQARMLLLRWCCTDYAPLCSSRMAPVDAISLENGLGSKKNDEIVGAGSATYSSVLDGLSDGHFPDWLNVVRCMLFMEPSDSERLNRFLLPHGGALEDESGWDEESKRINYCYEFGADLDDDMLWLVLNTATRKQKVLDPEVALLVLEHLFHCCTRYRKPSLRLKDPSVVWTLYMLVEYVPPVKTSELSTNGAAHDVEMNDGQQSDEQKNGGANGSAKAFSKNIARLAYPGLWWRVTGLALIICGASPDIVGAICWEEHPTLKALMKMVTSDRYRFPTVDCDDGAREMQKKTEQEMRDEEAKITELLFLSPKNPKRNVKEPIESDSVQVGPRTSRRQQEKREKILRKQKEKEEAEAHAEASRRRKLLRIAHKSIMLWDPKKGPRKPPKESADLIFSVGELFDLPRTFQKCTKPDFVLATIGSTTRGAIERAYDWLIPIISFLPETISRLPASASCFLLLRAYGTEGEEQSQLQQLSAPLLEHVHDSLLGEFGEANAIRAFDLLLTDLASHHPDRRSCARKVLQNAIGKEELQDFDPTFAGSNHTWIMNMIHVPHAISILADAVQHLETAASFERGSNLRFLVLALHKINTFALDNALAGDWNFASMVVALISRRPTVFAAALSSFSDLCSLAIHAVLDEFKFYIEKSRDDEISQTRFMVQISLFRIPFEVKGVEGRHTKTVLPLALLQSSCVLLSIWSGDSQNATDITLIEGLLKMLMEARGSSSIDDDEEVVDEIGGLASAIFVDSQKSAISVESWVMLAKSRSDFIAQRAALTAPSGFLPRLLLCSGLPRASLFSMVDRLGRLGEKAADRNKTFSQLMVPSASSEWDIGRLGQRREVSRKLLGRLAAYSRMHQLSELKLGEEMSVTFLEWLSETCQSVDKPAKQKVKKAKAAASTIYASLDSAENLLSSTSQDGFGATDGIHGAALDGDASEMTDFLAFEDSYVLVFPNSLDNAHAIKKFLRSAFVDNKASLLDRWLEENYTRPTLLNRRIRRSKLTRPTKLGGEEISFLLLQSYMQLERKVESLASCIVKWVPKLSASRGSPELWTALFAMDQKPSFLWEGLVSRCSQTWSSRHCIQCRDFLLSQGKTEELDLVKVVRFIVNASNFSAVHVESFGGVPMAIEDAAWEMSEDAGRRATRFALDCLQNIDYDGRLRSRNDPPECAVLLVLIARRGRNQVQFVCDAVMERIQNERGGIRTCLILCLLRLYAYFPFSMNLGSTVVRSFLKEAVEICACDWLSWRSPLDDSLEDMLDAALSNDSGPRSAQPLSNMGQKHPLLLLRKLKQMALALENDASVIEDDPDNEILGIVAGQSLDGPIQAQVKDVVVNVDIKYWGFNYRESHWFVVLDVISAVPEDVLFGCGLKMGLIQLLEVYLRLIFVQSQLRTSDRFLKLKAKFSDLLEKFKVSNPDALDGWLATTNNGLPSLGPTRNILMGCGIISLQQAIDHVKKKTEDLSDDS
jgi:integrator complex subunit 1